MTPASARTEAHSRTVRELLGKKHSIDYYQREYVWKERQVLELIADLTGRFLDSYHADHHRRDVAAYGRYFLGSIVISRKPGRRLIVDGQQRLTTLTLLLIHLLHQSRDARCDVRQLIYSERYGDKSFNLDVLDRQDVMRSLLEQGEAVDAGGASESARNIADRYGNIADHLPEQVAERALPHFVDWLLDNVDLVEISAPSDEDAYTIFETTNERGLKVSRPEMLKGYVLGQVGEEQDRQELNETWKTRMQDLKELGDEQDVYFFMRWLRARHAETNRDYERIPSEFHRWVRDKRQDIGLVDSDAFVRFVRRDLDFYACWYVKIRRAALKLKPGWESVRYNGNRGFPLQTQVLLACLTPDDDDDEVERKVALVADFLDIWIARRAWNFRRMGYSSVKRAMFTLTKHLRESMDISSLSEFLRDQLDKQGEDDTDWVRFRLTRQNYRQVKHILARLTHWVDTQCGVPSDFDQLALRGHKRPFEIEHIWSIHYDRFTDSFPHRSDFYFERNRLGGLLLIPRKVNLGLSDKPYADKRKAYLEDSGNLLAQSLHPDAYEKVPELRRLQECLPLLQPYDSFGPEQQKKRQTLYVEIAKRVWDPSRLELDAK